MRRAVATYGLMVAALFLAGPLAWVLTAGVHDPTGGHGGTVLLFAESMPVAFVRGAGASLIAVVVGLLSARLVSLRWGLWNAGVVMAWASAGVGTVDQVLRARGSASGLLGAFAVEGGLLAVLAAGFAFLAGRVARERWGEEEGWSRGKRVGMIVAAVVASAVGVAVGTRVGMIDNLKGQAIFSVLAGSVLGGILATIVWPRHPAWTVVLGVAVVAVFGPMYAMATVPAGQLVEQIFGGTLVGFARITPMDWAAGALLGTPMGMSIAGGLMGREQVVAGRA
ncbi:MAG: hypothetical protein LW822_04150 [Phycisphaeraceae bacterium]|nr:hypothetical protein [Phycisphaeraceae bacterium]